MNVRTLAAIAAGLVLISGIVTASLWQALLSGRQQTAALQRRVAASTAARAPSIDTSATTPSPVPVPVPASAPAISPQGNATAPPVEVAPPAVRSTTSAPVLIVSSRDLLKDPEYRKARIATTRLTIRQGYPGLAEELRLTNEEADRFFDILAETQIAQSELAIAEGAYPSAVVGFATGQRALQGQQSKSLRSLLGNTRYTQWEEYQDTGPARTLAGAYVTMLTEAGLPLSNAQIRIIATAMVDERKNLERDVLALAHSTDTANPQSRQQAQETLARRQQESSQRVIDAVFPYLSAQQVAVLRTQFEQQDTIARATVRARERALALPAEP